MQQDPLIAVREFEQLADLVRVPPLDVAQSNDLALGRR